VARLARTPFSASSAPVQAARLPDWAARIAETAPETGEGLTEHVARVLLSETLVTVEPDGNLHVRQRRAVQALSPRAEEIGLGYFSFDDRTEILKSKGWHLPPEGKAKKSRGGALDITLDSVFLSDQRLRVIGVQDVEKGSLVFFEFEAIEQPYQLVYQTMFYEDAPTDAIRVVVEVPPNWSVDHEWLRHDGPEPTVAEGQWEWKIEHYEPPEPEPLGDSTADRAPMLVVRFAPPSGQSVSPASFEGWVDLARWYEELARGRDVVTPEIERIAAKLDAETSEGFFPRVQVTGDYVRDQVRYVAKEIGVGGYRPRPAGDVLENLYGDCKDKGTLFRALLATAGNESYPILINATLEGTVSDRVPSLQAFNHFVIGVPIPEGTPVPAAFQAATVEVGDLGRLLVVDTTDEYTSVGWLPAALGGKTALVVAGDRSALVELPADDPSSHRVEIGLDAEIQDDLTIQVRVETAHYGAPASESRYGYRQSAQDYREATERELLDRWPAITIEDFSVVDEADDGAFVERLTVRVNPPPNPDHAEPVSLFPGALDGLARISLRRREGAVRYPHALTLRYESVVRGIRSNTATPPSETDEGQGWSVKSEFSAEPGTIRGSWELTLSRVHFEPDDFAELKRFWRAARSTSSVAVDRAR
jgi:transglutaminase-like putative cysteine protease